MSVRIMALVWVADLPVTDKLVLLALADCASDEGKCWPGIKSLCTKTGQSERTLQRAIKRLAKADHLTREEVVGVGCNYLIHPQASLLLYPRQNDAPVRMTPPSNRAKTPVKSCKNPRQNDAQTIKKHKEPSGTVSPNGDDPPVTPDEIVEAWNDRMAPQGFPAVLRLTEARRKHLVARIRENSVDDWHKAFDALERSAFCKGENSRGWKADFDTVLQPKFFTKLLEGAFDH